jgi:hypothetical protein
MSDPTQEILEKLNTIEWKIDNLNERLEKIEVSTGVMDEHVQWVNGVHNVIKQPLFTALNAFNAIVNPLCGPTVDILEVPNAPTYTHGLTHITDEEN